MELHPRPEFAIEARHRLTRRRRQPLSRRLRARVFAAALDRALADGADPQSEPTLTLRAEHLRSAHLRHALAAGLRDTARRAHRPNGLSSAAPISRSAVLANEQRITMLADLLEAEPAGDPGGIAAVNLLLTDGTSPLWVSGEPHELQHLLELALFRLGSGDGMPR